jgi:L-seryl-tRNA(Ser) seleniumtransferase
LLPSAALALTPVDASGAALEAFARRFRALPIPVVGRIERGRVLLDLRCLESEAEFAAQLSALRP